MPPVQPVPRPLLDWYGVFASHRKEEADGRVWSQDPPRGVCLAVQPARCTGVFLRPERPWEQDGALGLITAAFDEGRYRLWYTARDLEAPAPAWCCYAESSDGFAWTRPDLGLVERGGSRQNNILCRAGEQALGAVCVDPAAPPEERYKAVEARGRYFRDGRHDPSLDKARFRELQQAMELGGVSPEERRRRLEVRQALYASVSPDGLRWRRVDEPILDVGATQLDTQNQCAYDPYTGRYVAYLRGHLERRRLVRRAEGVDFRRLGEPRPCLMADALDPVDDDVYTPCYAPYPGRPLYLMFPAIYHRLASTVDVQLAISRDSYLWTRPSRSPIIGRGHEEGEYGTVYACPGLVDPGRGEWRLAYWGSPRRHDFLDRGVTRPEATECRWACWDEDRLVGLEAPEEGWVTLVERPCAGAELRLNYRTALGGSVEAELVDPPETPPRPVEALPGFARDEAAPLSGDARSAVVRWRGSSDLSALAGRPVAVRLHLRRATVFAVSW